MLAVEDPRDHQHDLQEPAACDSRTPHHVYTSSRLVVFVLVLLVDAQDPVDSCVSNINLRKNTVYVVSSGSMLNISCPVSYCKDVPTVKWIKIDTNNFIVISETNQITITQIQKEPKTIISYLSIRNVSKIEQGFYRCMISYSNFSSESHNIIVNVSGSRKSNSHRQNEYTQDMRNRSKSNDVLREIVYATLQHPAPREESAVWHVSTEQLVEYASIQIA
ncbi:hypothetical protein C0J45_2482 [Silurus meridionalis]|nr:hypothetical protein C0J45_2482 [Silurus meridionalis]